MGRRLGLTLLALYGVYLLVAAVLQERLYFPRYLLAEVDERGVLPAGVESIWIEPEAGVRVEAWLGMPSGAGEGSRGVPLVVFTHGNAEVIDENAELMAWYMRAGFAVLAPEYRGYGRSGGEPSQEAITGDVLAFIDEVRGREALRDGLLIYHGRSIGGGIAGSVAARRAPDGLVIESSFTSLRAMLGRYLVPSWLARNHMDTGSVLGVLDVPSLIVHGDADLVIPVSHARSNARVARDAELLIVGGAGHNDIFVGDPVVWEGVVRLVERVKARRASAGSAGEGDGAGSGGGGDGAGG